MDRMKQFFKYFLILAILYIVVDIVCVFLLKDTYNNKRYSIAESDINIEVTEAKATFVNGYVKGIIKNDTDKAITNKYLQVSAYSKRDVLLGTKYVKLKDLYLNEKAEFESRFNYEQIDYIDISVLDGKDLKLEELDFGMDIPEEAKMTFWTLYAAAILFIIPVM